MPTQKPSIITIRVSTKTRTHLFREAKRLDTSVSMLLRDLIDAYVEERIKIKPPQPKGLYK